MIKEDICYEPLACSLYLHTNAHMHRYVHKLHTDKHRQGYKKVKTLKEINKFTGT